MRLLALALLLAPTAVMAITHHLRKVPYDPENDFAPIASVSSSYGIVAARKDLPASNMAELVALARREPGKLTFGSAGTATATHLSGEIVHNKAGIKVLHIPYKGSAESLNDLVGGRIDLIYDPVALVQIKAGNLKALGVTSAVRHPELPGVPGAPEVPELVPDVPELLPGVSVELLHAALRLEEVVLPARLVADDRRLDQDDQLALFQVAIARAEQHAPARG